MVGIVFILNPDEMVVKAIKIINWNLIFIAFSVYSSLAVFIKYLMLFNRKNFCWTNIWNADLLHLKNIITGQRRVAAFFSPLDNVYQYCLYEELF